MFDWSLVVPTLINIVVLSIPEEAFLVLFSLLFMKRYDLVEFKKKNYLRISYIVIPVAVISNISRVFWGLDANIIPFAALGIVTLLIIFIFGIKNPKNMFKVFISVCISFLVVLALELLFFPIITLGIKLDASELNKPGIKLIILSIPERVGEIVIISLMLLKKRQFMKMSFFKVITRNKSLAYISGIVVFLNFLFLFIMFKLIYLDRILIELNKTTQVLIIVMIIVFPMLNITVLLSVINYAVNKFTYTKVYFQEETKVLKVLVNFLIQQKRYDEINMELGSFVEEVKKIK